MYRYLFKLQYLGFRYSGWAKNRDVRTIHQMVDKTLSFIFPDDRYKTLGCSRTDAMVSANLYYVQMSIENKIVIESFIDEFNVNLPPDIRVLSIESVSSDFNVIHDIWEKEYLYLFTFGEKIHPFCAPLMAYFPCNLDIPLMISAAGIFRGKHDFVNYCTEYDTAIQSVRTVTCSEIVENTLYSASFFPERSYLYRVRSKGFMRNQVRLMAGQLIEAGKGNLSLEKLSESLVKKNDTPFRAIAPASGLMLHDIEIDKERSGVQK